MLLKIWILILLSWLTGNVSDLNIVGDVTPAEYSFHRAARIHKKNGGVGILPRDSICAFRQVFWKLPNDICISGITVDVSIIYWLHPTKKNGVKAEFSWFADSLATNNGHLLILGDFNINWECQTNTDPKQLADILRSANLRRHVQERTHRFGHILDLVMMMTIWLKVSSMLCDHFLVNINVSSQKQSVPVKFIPSRRYKSINKEAFLADLRVSSLVLGPPDDVDIGNEGQ